MATKKLYIVSVETEMAVYAEDQKAAEELARRHLREEDGDIFAFVAHELKDLRMLDADLADSIPWGVDKSVRKSVREIFEAQRGG